MIEIVSAVIVSAWRGPPSPPLSELSDVHVPWSPVGRVLLVQREPLEYSAFAWECPSAQVTQRDAEGRETAARQAVCDALGVVVESLNHEPLAVIEEDKGLHYLYEVRALEPQSKFGGCGRGFGWFAWDEMVRMSLTRRGRYLLAIKRRLDAA